MFLHTGYVFWYTYTFHVKYNFKWKSRLIKIKMWLICTGNAVLYENTVIYSFGFKSKDILVMNKHQTHCNEATCWSVILTVIRWIWLRQWVSIILVSVFDIVDIAWLLDVLIFVDYTTQQHNNLWLLKVMV